MEEGLKIISGAYGIDPEVRIETIPPADFREACRMMPLRIREMKKAGARIALDITPGRKALIAAALVSSLDDLEHIFYLAITSTEGAAKPYMMLPLQTQSLKDFREEMRGCMGVDK